MVNVCQLIAARGNAHVIEAIKTPAFLVGVQGIATAGNTNTLIVEMGKEVNSLVIGMHCDFWCGYVQVPCRLNGSGIRSQSQGLMMWVFQSI